MEIYYSDGNKKDINLLLKFENVNNILYFKYLLFMKFAVPAINIRYCISSDINFNISLIKMLIEKINKIIPFNYFKMYYMKKSYTIQDIKMINDIFLYHKYDCHFNDGIKLKNIEFIVNYPFFTMKLNFINNCQQFNINLNYNSQLLLNSTIFNSKKNVNTFYNMDKASCMHIIFAVEFYIQLRSELNDLLKEMKTIRTKNDIMDNSNA